ncbi:MAG: alpha/beta hydrolase [Rhodospirillaceae bacterium]|nr:alpha/beta hydrolase [Rhodospirillaceae bacterium]
MKFGLAAAILTVVVLGGFVLFARSGGLETDPAAALARHGAPPSQFVEIDGTRLHFRDEGHGPALLLLHGSRASLHQWDGWVRELGADFRIVRVDGLAHGLTGPDGAGAYTEARASRLLAGLLDHLQLDRVLVAGTSSGSTQAIRFAAAYPDRVQKLSLSTVPLILPSAPSPNRTRDVVFWLHQNVLGTTSTDLYWRVFLESIYADPGKVSDEQVARYRALNGMPDQRRRQQDMIANWYARGGPQKDFEVAGQVKVPVLIQWGAAGPVLPRDIQCDITKAFSAADVRVIVYPNLGHKLVMEDAATTAADARRFLIDGEGPRACDDPPG